MRIACLSRSSDYRHLADRLAQLLPDHEVHFHGTQRPPDFQGVEAIFLAGSPLGRDVLESADLGFVQTIGTGYEHVDVTAATELGVWVANMKASATGNAESVAEHALLLLLALARHLTQAEQVVRRGSGWALPMGTALLDKVACIVGLGDVGAALAARLRAFGVRLVGVREHAEKGGPEGVQVFGAHALHEALGQADFVLLAARAGPGNQHLMDAAALAAMKRGALLVNIARGSLVDTEALLEALRSGQVGGAGLDVFEQEPVNSQHPLFQHPQVIATAHIAGVTDVNIERSLARAARNLGAYARGERPDFLVNAPPRPRRALR